MRYTLEDQAQATSLMKHLWPKVKESLAAGNQLTLEIKPASKSREQERKYHAILRDIAQQSQHMGAKWSADDWKRLLVQEFCRQAGLESGQIIPSLAGDGIVQLGRQTRKFTKEQASEFVDFLTAWCAEHGVTLNDGNP
jgi:hypothetical protein